MSLYPLIDDQDTVISQQASLPGRVGCPNMTPCPDYSPPGEVAPSGPKKCPHSPSRPRETGFRSYIAICDDVAWLEM